MIFLWIYLIGVVATSIFIACACACDPRIRAGLRKVEIDKAMFCAFFWPIFWIFVIFFR